MARNLDEAAATAEARIPDPLRCPIFRSTPDPARPRRRRAQAWAVEKALALVPRGHAARLPFRRRRDLLPLAATASFVAWAYPLFVPTSISRLSSLRRMFLSRRISFSRFLVLALVCGVAWFSALEIFSVSGWTRRASRFPRIDRAVLVRSPPRGEDRRLVRQMRAQLRAKCESAPLRRSVTEREM